MEPVGVFGQSRIDLEQIDPQKALFARAKASEFAGMDNLDPNYLYNANISFHLSDIAAIPVDGTNCVWKMCTTLFAAIAVPGTQRIQTGLLNNDGFRRIPCTVT